MRPVTPFEYRDGILHCDQVALDRIAREVGTPCYVYGGGAIVRNLGIVRECFADLDPKICYAVKANANLSILRVLAREGSSFDIVSGGELYRLNRIGVAPDRIIFSGVGKAEAEIDSAIQQGIFALVVESASELELIAERAGDRKARIFLRLNPEIDARTHPYISTGLRQNKFGIDLADLPAILELLHAHPTLSLIGIGSHIGSQVLDIEPFVLAFTKIRELADSLRNEGFPLTHLDLGGGFGIPYHDESPIDLPSLSAQIGRSRGNYRVVMEPGRFIVGKTGILLTRVLHWKSNHGRHFAVVDAAMNDLIRPALYGAYHEVRTVRQRPAELRADVVGPVCESADFLAQDRDLPKLGRDDLLAVMDAGAYAFVSSSNYNARPRCAEVLVDGEQFRVVRRRETNEDLVALEIERGSSE
ncbi:MAG: diaminopimelate decarboxylase [Acidobacteriota bacterium]|jgi:diaminopimelate decarboxylase